MAAQMKLRSIRVPAQPLPGSQIILTLPRYAASRRAGRRARRAWMLGRYLLRGRIGGGWLLFPFRGKSLRAWILRVFHLRGLRLRSLDPVEGQIVSTEDREAVASLAQGKAVAVHGAV